MHPRAHSPHTLLKPAAPQPLEPLPNRLPTVEQRAKLPAGFRVGGLMAGIKPSGRPDLAIVATNGKPAAAAAVFTRNQVVAAPIKISRRHLSATEVTSSGRFGWADAVIATAGCANAATGVEGEEDQYEVCKALAAALGTRTERSLALSTGVIGVRLPLNKVRDGITRLVPELAETDAALDTVSRCLMTTDTVPKLATATVEVPGPHHEPVAITVSGVAKGVGMIHPRMATMLAIVMTDAAVAPAALHAMLSPIAQRTWNQTSVDGDTSTNDTVFVLASGAAGVSIAEGTPEAATFAAAVEAVARNLARQQAADGEGATTLITAQVSGAADDHDARAVARSIVSSQLLKAAVYGRDPNWGRVASGAGNARLPDAEMLVAAGMHRSEASARAGRLPELDVDKMRISIAGTLVYAGGPLEFDRPAVAKAMNAPEVLIRVDLGIGGGTGEAFGCDLTEGYVKENAEYTT